MFPPQDPASVRRPARPLQGLQRPQRGPLSVHGQVRPGGALRGRRAIRKEPSTPPGATGRGGASRTENQGRSSEGKETCRSREVKLMKLRVQRDHFLFHVFMKETFLSIMSPNEFIDPLRFPTCYI